MCGRVVGWHVVVCVGMLCVGGLWVGLLCVLACDVWRARGAEPNRGSCRYVGCVVVLRVPRCLLWAGSVMLRVL